MVVKRGWLFLAAGLAAACAPPAAPHVPALALHGTRGEVERFPSDLSGARYTVFVFVSADCPCFEAHEARLAPKPAWTRDKMTPERFEGLLKAIVGYELAIEELRGNRKLGQNKRGDELAGAVAGLTPFNPIVAGLMREAAS